MTDGALKIGIAGAGAIGCFVGGRLAQAGHDVRFLARMGLCKSVRAKGLRLTDFEGRDDVLEGLSFSDDPVALEGCDLILVCVKSAATAQMGGLIARYAPSGAVVISLQNGVTNAAELRAALPDWDVRAGTVPFNVTGSGEAAFHRGTSGAILVERRASGLPDLSAPGLEWEERGAFEEVQWGKLLVNLNNALNALSDLPLLEQLMDARWRRLMADQMGEALAVLRAAGIRPAKFMALPPALVPHVLRLPTPLFRRIAAKMLTIDPQARSSMWDDLTARRMTEVDALQGAVLTLAAEHGVQCPLMERIVTAVRQAEAAGEGPPGIAPDMLRV